jgi:MT0933-like antitoxin protein
MWTNYALRTSAFARTDETPLALMHAPGQGGRMDFLGKANELINEHDEQVDQALDKAGDFGKERFAGHDAQIDGLIDQAQQRTGAGDTTQAPPPPPAEAPQQ